MKQNKRNIRKSFISFSVLLFLLFIIELLSANKESVERYYSTGIYARLSVLLRSVAGRVPFSISDVVFLLVFVYCLSKIFFWIYSAFQRQITFHVFLYQLLKIVNTSLTVYILFLLCWGLNYKRKGISFQLHFDVEAYTTEQLKSITADLVKKVNASRSDANMYTFRLASDEALLGSAAKSYQSASYQYSFLSYHSPCIKQTIASRIYNYFGILGYYNPFTAEAQINTSAPRFLLPYIANHEIAHQLGYADEDEANFVAYLVSKDSYENAFPYSAYFTLYNYANRQLYATDSASAEANNNALDSLVKVDEATYHHYLGGRTGVGARYSTALYNNYLKANHQSKGMKTYDHVIAMLIAYQKKYGDL